MRTADIQKSGEKADIRAIIGMQKEHSDIVLVVEDTDSLREVLQSVLEKEGYRVDACATGEDAATRLNDTSFSLILSDFKLPGMNGIDLLKLTREHSPSLPFLVMTAYGSIEIAVEAMKFGANDFICKPFEPETLCSVVREVIDHKQLIDRQSGRASKKESDFLTADPMMLEILREARKAARFDSSVIISGESGTGKELLARYIHKHSLRNNCEFVSVNCAALPDELLESEFFGHEAGSFTGATLNRSGLFEIASRGTIFLDEIGDMPSNLQVKLLRALQEKEIKKVGGNKTIKVNPRIIAATNADIDAALKSGRLREDFYYRLAVIELHIPPLRERREDIAVLAGHFVNFFSQRLGTQVKKIDPLAMDVLCSYHWPGNARELENVIERSVILTDKVITADLLGIEPSLKKHAEGQEIELLPLAAERAARTAEISLIKEALKKTGGNKTKAAKILGVSYKTLLNKIKEYELLP